MAIVRAKYSKSKSRTKAHIRYIEHRAGREGEKVKRELFGIDGVMNRQQAYQMIDEVEKGTAYFRLVISPDPAQEDTEKDLHLQEIVQKTIQTLEERLEKEVPYIGAEHDDHTDQRHIHVVALVRGRLNTKDLEALRTTATNTALLQRQERDLQQQQAQQQKGLQWAM
jgi:predicted NUDIX family phosphoesterase